MQCPGCHANVITPAARLRIALRAQVRCPACGVQVRLSFWPRILHTVVADLSVVAGFVTSIQLAVPGPLVLSIAWWVALSLVVPASAAHAGPGKDSSES